MLYPAGNLSSTDAYFFGASASTESGLNPVDVNNLRLYQQIVLYFVPILGNMQVVSILIVVFRFFWFRQRLKAKVEKDPLHQLTTESTRADTDTGADGFTEDSRSENRYAIPEDDQKTIALPEFEAVMKQNRDTALSKPSSASSDVTKQVDGAPLDRSHAFTEDRMIATPPNTATRESQAAALAEKNNVSSVPLRIRFAADTQPILPPLPAIPDLPFSSDDEYPYALDDKRGGSHDSDQDLPKVGFIRTRSTEGFEASMRLRNQRKRGRSARHGPSPDRMSFHRVVSNAFELGVVEHKPVRRSNRYDSDRQVTRTVSRDSSLSKREQRRASQFERLKLSTNAALGRNSNFSNLTSEDKDRLGGIEYQSLKLLLRVIFGYYISLHLIGISCLTPWIFLTSEPKYRAYLAEKGINKVWWSIYSTATMTNNLGLTLTPDSMISFRDSVWPILIMTLLAYAGHTFYPICLRLTIWLLSKAYPKNHEIQAPLRFLLDHPRRCYTLLFPSRQTWTLAVILIALNVIDVILIICLDLDNPEVTMVPIAPRFISSIFQAASSRHTGTSTFNLASVSPGVQFSLLVMMYVSIFPIAISVRSSNTYEESSLGVYDDHEIDPSVAQDGKSYLMAHVRNQLSFDLWYIFLGCFCICCAESNRIMDPDPSFQVFTIFFEVASAYANVGLSLGHRSTSTSFSGVLSVFSKLVICAMMIRGRHRGLPVRLDRAILLPSDKFFSLDVESGANLKKTTVKRLPRLKQTHTQ